MHFINRSAFFFDMTCNEIIKYVENWAPAQIAWQKDNTGLQVGSGSRIISNILLCLEVTEAVLMEAVKKNCNMIISHHPLLFYPIKKLDFQNDKNSMLIEKLIQNNISLYSEHTNLDFTKGGVSFELAKKLKLQQIKFLTNLNSNQSKLIIFVPFDHLESVSSAIFSEGGGTIGNYDKCSFRTTGKGTFRGSKNSKPVIGEKEKFESVEEVKLEVIIDSWKADKILNSVRKVHPYEEIAFDMIPLANANVNYGIGAVGELNKTLKHNEFLNYVSKQLKIKNFRYSLGSNKNVKKVAVCGGSGSGYIKEALKNGADAFITADLRYHDFQEFNESILLIDAGHYETEIHSLNEVKRRIENIIPENSLIKVFKYSGSTNPIFFYNN